MTTLSEELKRRPPRPARTVVLAPSAFVADWGERPAGEVAVGIRTLSEHETLTASAEAVKEAVAGDRSGSVAQARYQEALMCWAVGFAACTPNDATLPYFQSGDEGVRRALTPEAIRRLFDELELAQAGDSPVRPAATDDDLAALAALLAAGGPLEQIHPARALRVRRWLRFCLDELRPPTH